MIYCNLLIIALVSLAPVVEAQTVGWRTDGGGNYLDADIPIAWSASENVIWKTPMPAWSNASPVVVGDRLYVLGEQTLLLCLDRASGQILWQASNHYQEVLDAPALQHFVRERREARSKLEAQLRKVEAELAAAPEGRKAQPLRAQARQLRRQIEAKIDPLHLPTTDDGNGYASSTPISDGQHVWAVFGTGVVVCYHRDGQLRWARLLQETTNRRGHSASPRMIDGKLIVAIIDLFALDPMTGRTLWRTPSEVRYGTPAVTTVGQTPLVLTPAGLIVNAHNGQILYDRLPRMKYNGPVIVGDTVYCIGSTASAWRLPANVDEPFEPQHLWTARARGSRLYASPVVHNGLIYTISREEKLNVLDATNGELVYWRDMELGEGIDSAYTSVCMTANGLIVASFSGQFAVFKPGRTYRLVARNQLEPLRSTPTFVGNRMYVRGLEHVWCIGRNATAAR